MSKIEKYWHKYTSPNQGFMWLWFCALDPKLIIGQKLKAWGIMVCDFNLLSVQVIVKRLRAS